jgi:hypothetical protein
MLVNKPIDDLIEAGWHVLDSNFDEVAFLHWKRQALHCFSALLGPDHRYTEDFRNYVKQVEKENARAGGCLSTATMEQTSPNC